MYLITAPELKEYRINLPASKSVTHRILILGSLNSGRTFIEEPLIAEDTLLTLDALKNMGANIDNHDATIEIKNPIKNAIQDEIYLGNSGSSARFLIPIGGLVDKPLRFYGTERLHQRPFAELFSAFRDLNLTIESENDSLPATVFPSELPGGIIKLKKLPSSQIITALMMSALWMKSDLEITLPDDTPSLPYIKMTYKLMKKLGLNVDYEKKKICVEASKPGFDWNIKVEKDFSAASYWVVFSLIHKIKLILPGVTLPSLQGDERIFSIADHLGAEIMLYPDRLELNGDIKRGLKIDCNEIPDLVPTLSVMAMFAPEPCALENIKHLEYKESNRVAAIQTNIAALGGETRYKDGNLEIYPGKNYHGSELETFDDHRIAMSFAIAGSKIPGTKIKYPDCVQKSYPQFWEDFSFWQGDTNA